MSKLPTRSKIDLEKHCPNCRRPVKKRIDFCLDCGDFIEPVLTRSGRQRALVQDGNEKPEAIRVLRRSPLKGPVLLASAILGAILLGILSLTVYECCSSYDASHRDLVRLAEKYLASGEEENAVSVLERSLLEEKQPKQEQRRLLLDQALFALASKMAVQGKYRDAVTCYSRISPGFERHEEVEKLIAEYSDKALPVIFGHEDRGQEVSPVNILMHHSKDKSASMSRLEKAVMTVVPAAVATHSTKAISAPAAPVSTSVSTSAAAPALVPTNSNPGASAPASEPQANSMARYNELLANYFAHHGAGGDAPSYEEWVKSGTKDF